MIKRDILSWWFRPQFLQPWGKPAPVLFAGPWVGEFGWELLNWQAFLRWLAPRYSKVIVCCRAENRALYADFAHEFVFHQIQGTAECNVALEIQNPQEWDRIQSLIPAGADVLPTVGWQDQRKKFVKFGQAQSELQSDVVFHPRGRNFGMDRNWSVDNWNQLIQRLTEDGYKLNCIGLTSATLDVQGDFRELRNIPLEQTMDVMASTRLVVGPSSGPMHLASLVGAPHLVWTDREKYARGRTNRDKYENWWNPFGTPAYVLDQEGFQPSVSTVYQEIVQILRKPKGDCASN